MKYSIIISVWNQERYVGRCLESLLHQKGVSVPYEIILVDDGSTDRTREKVERYRSQKLRYYKIENQGPCMARKYGFDQSKGRYICFLDSDDFVAENYLATVDRSMGNGDVLEVGYVCLNGGQIIRPSADAYQSPLQRLLQYDAYLTALWPRVFRRELLENLTYKPYYYSEDFYLLVQIYAKAKRIVHIPDPLYYYRDTEQSLSKQSDAAGRMDALRVREEILDGFSRNPAMEKYRPYVQKDVLIVSVLQYVRYRRSSRELYEAYGDILIKSFRENFGKTPFFMLKRVWQMFCLLFYLSPSFFYHLCCVGRRVRKGGSEWKKRS